MPKPRSPVIEQLHALEHDPRSQAEYAAGLLGGRHGKDVMLPALAVLAEVGYPPARPALLRLYGEAAANKGVRDQGGYFRRALLDALRPIARPDDLALLVQAVLTYERWPPDFAEDAVLVRAAGLVALNRVDEQQARYHAARLLVDPYVQPMSGEPAATAARLLGAHGELTTLWMYVLGDHPAHLGEVAAECLRQLTELPAVLVPLLVERLGASSSPSVRLGLYHLLIHHREGPQERTYLRREMAELRDPDVYRYLAMTMAASGSVLLHEDLLAVAASTTEPRKVAILVEACALLQPAAPFVRMGAELRKRLGARGRGG
jgi:hypothetical protein